jgi:hypothetical protein
MQRLPGRDRVVRAGRVPERGGWAGTTVANAGAQGFAIAHAAGCATHLAPDATHLAPDAARFVAGALGDAPAVALACSYSRAVSSADPSPRPPPDVPLRRRSGRGQPAIGMGVHPAGPHVPAAQPVSPCRSGAHLTSGAGRTA